MDIDDCNEKTWIQVNTATWHPFYPDEIRMHADVRSVLNMTFLCLPALKP